MQSSVRHVPGPAGHSHSSSAVPQAGFDFGPPEPSYQQRERSASNGSQQNADGQSQNVPYRPRPSPGAMGVTG